MEELVFWQSNLSHLNGRRIWFIWLLFRTRSIPNIAVIMLSWGLKWPPKVIGLPFSAMESSMMREILAVRKLSQPFAPKLAELCVTWHTDSHNVARIIDVGMQSEV